MSTLFSVNLNKLALIRNSRGTDYPNLITFVNRLLDLGVKGFTVHPRPDERHIKYQDVYDISDFLKDYPEVEFNIEGKPNDKFLELIDKVRPHQCTLVPDSVDQLTSDHGYDIIENIDFLSEISNKMASYGTRCAVFVDPELPQIQAAIDSDISAIELYTESWARQYELAHGKDSTKKDLDNFETVISQFSECIKLGNTGGLRVNAGHDLNLDNLRSLLSLGDVAEVSIGHAFTIECIEYGMNKVVKQYLDICS